MKPVIYLPGKTLGRPESALNYNLEKNIPEMHDFSRDDLDNGWRHEPAGTGSLKSSTA
jgi:hypothetical protein